MIEISTQHDGLAQRYDRARAELAEARTDLERLRIRDEARAVREAAKILDLPDVVRVAQCLVNDAEAAVAASNPPRSSSRTERADLIARGDQVSNSHRERAEMSEMRRAAGEWERIRDTLPADEPVPTRTDLVRRARGAHVSSGGSPDWFTPPEIVEAARTAMGGIDLDPCSDAIPQRWIRATIAYTAADDGLSRRWAGRVWMNPPYAAGLVDRFVDHLLDSEDVTAAVVLTNNATETGWGQRLLAAADAVCLPAGRLRYWADASGPAHSPLQGQMITGIGIDTDIFGRAFDEIGAVLCAS